MQWTVRTNSPCENTYIREDANEYSNNSPSGHSCYPDRCTDRFIFLRKKSPEETANLLGEFLLAENTVVEKYNVVKGFLNFVIKVFNSLSHNKKKEI